MATKTDTETDTSRSRDRRAQVAALVGLFIQVAMFGMLLGVGLAYGSPAIRAEAIHLQFGIYMWLVIALMYTQRRRAGVEQLEITELKHAREATKDTGIFELEDEVMLVQRRRLNWMYRWFMPTAAMLLGAGHIVWSGLWYASALPVEDADWALCSNPHVTLPFVVGATFFCFLFSRYASGMARQREWRLLRAASSYMAGNALLGLFIVAAMALSIYEVKYSEAVVTYVIRIGMLVLGIEFLLNFVMDFYRPRMAGTEYVPAFESRLLGLISEPGGIARSIQEAINYQFGFEVSGTWFYQMLKRALLPLTLFAVLVLFGLSGIVVVDADERVFVERFGKLLQAKDAPLGSGLHFKYPWPIDVVRRRPVERLQRLVVGDKEAEDEGEGPEAILWTQDHKYTAEVMLLVASPQLAGVEAGVTEEGGADDAETERSVAVSLVKASVDIEFRVKSLYDYTYNYADPNTVIRDVAYQTLADYATEIDITSFMGPERERIGRELHELLQNRFDELELGVELTFVALQSAHPPSRDNVAKTFQDVIAARSRKEARIETARGSAERMLTEVAGSRARALALDKAIVARNRLAVSKAGSPEEVVAATDRVDELMMGSLEKGISPMSGAAAARIAAARAEWALRVSEAESKARTFRNRLAAFEAAPQLYKVREYLDVLTSNLQKVRKFVNATHDTELVVIIEAEKKSEFTLPEPTE